MEYCKKCALTLRGGYFDDPEGSSSFYDLSLSGCIRKPHSGRIIVKRDDGDTDQPIIDFYRGDDPDFKTETNEVKA
jgi:hypothetical protein